MPSGIVRCCSGPTPMLPPFVDHRECTDRDRVHAATNARCLAAGHGLSESRARAMVVSPLERDPGG